MAQVAIPRKERDMFGWDLPPGCSLADIDALFADEETEQVVLTDEQVAAMRLLIPILPSGEDFGFLDEDDLP
jgi:hypothetical protein